MCVGVSRVLWLHHILCWSGGHVLRKGAGRRGRALDGAAGGEEGLRSGEASFARRVKVMRGVCCSHSSREMFLWRPHWIRSREFWIWCEVLGACVWGGVGCCLTYVLLCSGMSTFGRRRGVAGASPAHQSGPFFCGESQRAIQGSGVTCLRSRAMYSIYKPSVESYVCRMIGEFRRVFQSPSVLQRNES